jgi:hypothetical protein
VGGDILSNPLNGSLYFQRAATSATRATDTRRNDQRMADQDRRTAARR